MRIFKPIVYTRVSQGFGENRACINSNGKVLYKAGSVCPGGFKDFYQSMGLLGHNGTDFQARTGDLIFFPVIDDCEWYALNTNDAMKGMGVDVISKSKILGEFRKFNFFHISQSFVRDGQAVKPGDLIAFAGSTGASSAPHLHMDMKFCDERGNTINKDNGFFGAVDFAPYYSDKYILEELGSVKPSFWGWLRSFL